MLCFCWHVSDILAILFRFTSLEHTESCAWLFSRWPCLSLNHPRWHLPPCDLFPLILGWPWWFWAGLGARLCPVECGRSYVAWLPKSGQKKPAAFTYWKYSFLRSQMSHKRIVLGPPCCEESQAILVAQGSWRGGLGQLALRCSDFQLRSKTWGRETLPSWPVAHSLLAAPWGTQ